MVQIHGQVWWPVALGVDMPRPFGEGAGRNVSNRRRSSFEGEAMTESTSQANGGDVSNAPRTAVVVLSGVGDDRPGSGRDSVVATLTEEPGAHWTSVLDKGELRLVAQADTGPVTGPGDPTLRTGVGAPNLRSAFPVPTASLSSDGRANVDIYEMHWADLSRAEGPAKRLFYLLFAITLQVSMIGLEALHGLKDPEGSAEPGVRRHLRWALNAMSYWLTVVLTPIVLAMFALAVAVNLEMLFGGGVYVGRIIFGVVGALGVLGGWWLGVRTYQGGWTFDRIEKPWGYSAPTARSPRPIRLTIAALVVVAIGALVWIRLGSQDAFARQLAYLLAVAAIVASYSVFEAQRLARKHRRAATTGESVTTEDIRRARRWVRRAICGGVAAVPLGAMVLAAYPSSNAPGLTVRTANAETAIAMGIFRFAWIVMLLLCSICALLAWRARRKLSDHDKSQRFSATVILSIMLGPVLYALAVSTAFMVFAALSKLYPDSATKRWGKTADLLQLPGATFFNPVRSPPQGSGIPTGSTWGYEIVRGVVQPLGLALALALLTLLALGCWFHRYLFSFRRRNGYASAADVSYKQGEAFTRGLSAAGSPGAFGVYMAIVLAVTGTAIVVWSVDNRWIRHAANQYLSGFALPVAYVLAVLAVAGIGAGNMGPFGKFGGGFLTMLARVLDIVYDIATYLRVENPTIVPPRVQMIGRYRALLDYLATTAPTDIVILAHSQGSILTLATLLGDQDRRPKVNPPGPDAIPDGQITVLTYGCPAKQTYERRFPGQFAHWVDPQRSPALDRWLNVYRAGDFIGRAIRTDDFNPTPERVQEGSTLPFLQERCLGPGHHTGYPSDERWRKVARAVIAAPRTTDLAAIDLGALTVPTVDEDPKARSVGAPV